MRKRDLKRVAVIAAGLCILAAAAVTTATAVLSGDVGGTDARVDERTNNAPSSTNSTAFVDLSGANVLVSVPANISRFYDVSFFAESKCAGPGSGGWCSMRVVATNVATALSVELRPQTGLDFAFDSDMAGVTDDLWEGHAMKRSMRLPGGSGGATYRIRVQYAVTNNTINFALDDWHLAVETRV